MISNEFEKPIRQRLRHIASVNVYSFFEIVIWLYFASIGLFNRVSYETIIRKTVTQPDS